MATASLYGTVRSPTVIYLCSKPHYMDMFALNLRVLLFGKSKSGFSNPKPDFALFGQSEKRIVNP